MTTALRLKREERHHQLGCGIHAIGCYLRLHHLPAKRCFSRERMLASNERLAMPDPVHFDTDKGPRGLRRLARVIHGEARQIWLKFLTAVIGLALAFAAALFSTVERESGNFWATLLLASVALLLSVLVGVTTVPTLARRVAGARLRDAFDYEVTRVGITYVAAVLIVGIAALNTGNNLLYMIVAAMLGAILVSGFASAMVLRGLHLDVRLPEHVFAGQMQKARIVVRNSRRWVPSLSIQVIAAKPKVKRKRWWRKSPPPKISHALFDASVYFPIVPAGKEVSAEIELSFDARGRYQQEGFLLATRFPFAFLTKTRRIPLEREIVVYPRVELADEALEALPIVSGEFEAFQRGRGYDLHLIREYMPEDSARHVDWKATARTGSLKVREFSREDEYKVRIVFDNPMSGTLSCEAYERAVGTAASLAWHFARHHAEASFATQNQPVSNDVYAFLRALALVDSGPSAHPNRSLLDAHGYNIVVTAQPRGSVPTEIWGSSFYIFVTERHHK
jgi:uncharacterized protein (DUF58 family)